MLEEGRLFQRGNLSTGCGWLGAAPCRRLQHADRSAGPGSFHVSSGMQRSDADAVV
jgi:hypothetical protein